MGRVVTVSATPSTQAVASRKALTAASVGRPIHRWNSATSSAPSSTEKTSRRAMRVASPRLNHSSAAPAAQTASTQGLVIRNSSVPNSAMHASLKPAPWRCSQVGRSL
ncbi:hypothetical protein D3C78_1624250 [compost metagenome]